MNTALAAIERLKDVPRNWDSYGAAKIDEAALAQASQLLLDLARRDPEHRYTNPIVGPDVGGGVELIWESAHRAVHALVSPRAVRVLVLADEKLIEEYPAKSLEDLVALLSRHIRP